MATTTMVKLKSHPCPFCKSSTEILITENQYRQLKSGHLIQNVLTDFSADIRERFISGICPDCWKEIFN